MHSEQDSVNEYVAYLASTVDGDISGMRVAVDCANGAAYQCAGMLFEKIGVKADILNDRPNGVNINLECGSTHLEKLKKHVLKGGYCVGIAFDGDADRCLIIDENGELIDGDRIMAICAYEWNKTGKLNHHSFVATVMSNIGLHMFAKDHGFRIVTSAVGDRYVLEKMLEGGYNLGGRTVGTYYFFRFQHDRRRAADGDSVFEHIKKIREDGILFFKRNQTVSSDDDQCDSAEYIEKLHYGGRWH